MGGPRHLADFVIGDEGNGSISGICVDRDREGDGSRVRKRKVDAEEEEGEEDAKNECVRIGWIWTLNSAKRLGPM